jgi:CheY-like chemotaxis protein
MWQLVGLSAISEKVNNIFLNECFPIGRSTIFQMATGNDKVNLKVLVIDDDDIVLFLHDLMIRESGLSSNPLSFSNGKAALDHLKENYRITDSYLVFLDINMPVMNGWQFLELIEELRYQVTVIIVSSSIDSADYQRAKKYPAVKEYVTKPLTIESCVRIKESYVLND